MFNFKTNKVNFQECLGKGGFGSVYPYQRNKDDKKWAVKVIKVSHRELPFAIMEEIVLGFKLNHPNVLKVAGFDLRPHGINNPKLQQRWENFTEWDMVIKLPRMKESLQERLKKQKINNEKISEEEILKIFYQIASGLKYLHQNKIAHMNLKPDNILFAPDDVVVLSGMERPKFLREETCMAGTPDDMAPGFSLESDRKKPSFYKIDIWNFGMIMLKICSQEDEILSYNERQIEHIVQKNIESLNYSQFLKDLLLQMLRTDPTTRIEINQLHSLLESATVIDIQDVKTFEKTEDNKSDCTSEVSGTTQATLEFDRAFPEDFEDKEKKSPEDIDRKESHSEPNSLFRVRDELRNHYGELFEFEVNEDQSLRILSKAQGLTDDSLGGMLEKLAAEVVDKNCRKFKTFSLSLPFCEKINGDSFSKLFGSQTLELSNLELDLEHTSVKKGGLKELAVQIQNNLQSLENLSIHFPYQVNGSGVESFAMKVFPSLTNLKQIGLTMSHAKLSDEEFKQVAKHISGLQYLEKLQLDLHDCNKLTNIGFKDLIVPIASNCTNLKYLDLNFSKCPRLSISDLKKSPPVFNNLHYLNLNFSQCGNIRDDGAIEIANYMVPHIKNLKYLDLNYSQCKITDDGLFKLVEQICLNLPGLEHLLLGFAGSHSSGGMITGEGLLMIIDPIKSNLKNLQHLHFDLKNCNQSVEEALGVLKDAFCNLVLLTFNKKVRGESFAFKEEWRSLEIQQKSEKVNNSTFQEMFIELIPEIKYKMKYNLFKIGNLAIKMKNCPEITDESLEYLTPLISNLEDLNQLQLDFLSCANITDLGLEGLAFVINQHLKHLKHLQLNFSTCERITDSGIKKLTFNPNLLVLKLDFSWCDKITNEGFNALTANIVSNLKKLKELQLNFSWCEEITNLGIKEFAFQISTNLQNMEQLNLDFTECEKINSSGLENLASLLSQNMKNLRHVQLHFSSSRFDDKLQGYVRDQFKHIPMFVLR